MTTEVEVGDIVQINTAFSNSAFWCCCAVVEEVRDWGVIAYVMVPGHPQDWGVVMMKDGRAYVRVPHDEYINTGGKSFFGFGKESEDDDTQHGESGSPKTSE